MLDEYKVLEPPVHVRLRDRLAMAALTGFVSIHLYPPKHTVEECYIYADLMLEARQKQ